MRTLVCSIDGASRGNPGKAACGIVIEFEGARVVEKGVPIGETTNNVAEYFALILGLAECGKLKGEAVRVRSDSLLLVKQMQGEYKVKDPWLRRLRLAAASLAETFARVTYEHVAREDNADADRAANSVFGSDPLF